MESVFLTHVVTISGLTYSNYNKEPNLTSLFIVQFIDFTYMNTVRISIPSMWISSLQTHKCVWFNSTASDLPPLGEVIQTSHNSIICPAFPFQNLKSKFLHTEVPLQVPYMQQWLPIQVYELGINLSFLCPSIIPHNIHTFLNSKVLRLTSPPSVSYDFYYYFPGL